MAKMESEDTNWVIEELPSFVAIQHIFRLLRAIISNIQVVISSWQHAIYTVNPSMSPSNSNNTLTTPLNKGHEAMAYLTYIIDNYASLPSIMAFIHPHRSGFLSAWHTDTPLHSNVDALTTLQISFVEQNGYANLRCNWNPGCLAKHTANAHVTKEVWHDIFSGTSTDKGETHEAPSHVGAACCAQFVASRSRVMERPLSDYEHFRQWIIDTEMTDAKSGRVFEFLWHVIFGMQPI
ncbi:uncharacterized protein KY384_008537 [Bacidia gigantensis]|uniref:uncharacterized protein n=1 Tax=Bacidia gigantensis TaxID=2732470 RepID=UPI001D05B33D|nr:uncharacterized protein KY384_008537 [Bacidia gigantensis]KAG8527108.1 hypothetical protein KY384_008537 [Bacidia gigantensis]